MLEGRPIEIPSGRIDRWKLENGQWKWYHDASKDTVMTLVGATSAAAPGSAPIAAPKLPKDFSPEEAAKAGKSIPASHVPVSDRSRQNCPSPSARSRRRKLFSTTTLPGEMRVEADLIADYPGFIVQPKKLPAEAQEETTFRVTYHPSDKGVFNASSALDVQPFESEWLESRWFSPRKPTPASLKRAQSHLAPFGQKT